MQNMDCGRGERARPLEASRRTFLGTIVLTATAAAIVGIEPAAAGGADPFIAAADAYEAELAAVNAISGLDDDEFAALLDARIDPLVDVLAETPIRSPAAALRAMDLTNDRRCSLTDATEEAIRDALHDFLRALNGVVA